MNPHKTQPYLALLWVSLTAIGTGADDTETNILLIVADDLTWSDLGFTGIVTPVHPLKVPVKMPVSDAISLESSPVAKKWGVIVVVATVALYLWFW